MPDDSPAPGSFDVSPELIVIDTDHYPHFGVYARRNQPRGFAYALDPVKDPTFLALAATAKFTGKKLRVFYTSVNHSQPSIEGVTKVVVLG